LIGIATVLIVVAGSMTGEHQHQHQHQQQQQKVSLVVNARAGSIFTHCQKAKQISPLM
jgi:hypothetical protein